ncbi:hypothetical protein SUDANB121_02284 [Nocardiopsis dassonvillei]|uniref:hypothetical protein n=1 Tax=Nocardiopsis dassonvillei TaxID=2014 RepID=UPI003F564CF6
MSDEDLGDEPNTAGWGDEELFDELLRRLNLEDRTAGAAPGRAAVLLHGGGGREPYVLHVSPSALGTRLRSTAEEAREAFPGTEPQIAALRLFLVHVEEAVETAPPGHRHLVLDPGGVYARPTPG